MGGGTELEVCDGILGDYSTSDPSHCNEGVDAGPLQTFPSESNDGQVGPAVPDASGTAGPTVAPSSQQTISPRPMPPVPCSNPPPPDWRIARPAPAACCGP